MDPKKRKIITVLLLCLLAATIWFIFSNSMESIPDSKEKSEGLLRWLKPLLERLVGKGNATNHLVRKLAHFVEFFALGAELCALCVLWNKPLLWVLFFGLLTALTDETIQIFYDRGSQVQDVWLDFAAVVATAVLTRCGKAIYLLKSKDRS